MPLPELTVHRHGRRTRALITLSGEIDLKSAPLVRASIERCLRDGIRTIGVDLTPVTFRDHSGLSAFLHASQQTAAVGGTLRLHCAPAKPALLISPADTGFLLRGLPFGHLPPATSCRGRPRRAPSRPVAPACSARARPLRRCAVSVFASTNLLIRPHPQDRGRGERTTARLDGLAHDAWTRVHG